MAKSQSNTLNKIKVCIVGAGAAGLCAAHHLAVDSKRFEFTVFERQKEIGGTWIYTDKIGVDDDGLPVHSSMYRDLRTNLPKEIMSFPDFPEIRRDGKSCVTHDVILEYLKSYATHFQLYQYIKFHTIVESIKLSHTKNTNILSTTEKWEVQIKDLKFSKTEILIFDAIIICSGHYFEPYIPQIPGLNDFRGQMLHSHYYRKPEDFAGKKVVLLGAGSSGIDIALEVSGSASQVYLSHNKDRLGINNELLSLTEVAGIEKFEDRYFVFKDGMSIDADALIFCTGYNFTYKFLDDSCGVKVDNNYVLPLYKHFINVNHPSMCFIGIPMIVVPFPLFHMQVQYFLSTLRDKNKLPSHQIMLEDSKLKALNKRHAHKLHTAQWAYNNSLAQAGDFEQLPPYYENGYVTWSDFRKTHLRNYKSFDLVIENDGKSVRIVDKKDRRD